MKILSWNVAGVRAVLKKNALDFVCKEEYDIICLQETKAVEAQVELPENLKTYFLIIYLNKKNKLILWFNGY